MTRKQKKQKRANAERRAHVRAYAECLSLWECVYQARGKTGDIPNHVTYPDFWSVIFTV